MQLAVKSDIGRVRSVNEDRAAVQAFGSNKGWAVIADGMGGHQAGDTASQLAIDMIRKGLDELDESYTLEQCQEKITSVIEAANTHIFQCAQADEHLRGMGTTIVLAWISGDDLLISHVGDSRAYLYQNETLTQLTEDHSLVNELVKSGQITKEEADHHPRRNVLTRALGTEEFIWIDHHSYKWEQGNMLLLCSDGLTNKVDLETITNVMASKIVLEDKVNELVDLALQAGGDDNVSVILLLNDTEVARKEEK